LVGAGLTPHDEAPAVEDANLEYARFAFVVALQNRGHRKGTGTEAQAMRLGSASA
jgi:hypothetical protein